MSEKSLLTILAPMYTPDERETTRKIMVYLRKQGFAVYQPHDDGLESGLFSILARSTSPAPADKGRENHRAILLSCALDYYKLAVQSDACILIMDGRVPFSGQQLLLQVENRLSCLKMIIGGSCKRVIMP
jgi:hypothetical protein